MSKVGKVIWNELLYIGNNTYLRNLVGFGIQSCQIIILRVFLFSVCLRLQVNPENKNEFQGLSAERGFADFIFAHLVLHIVVINFIG